MKIDGEYRERLLRMAVETKLESVKEMYNHCLKMGKTGIKKEQSEFFVQQYKNLHKELGKVTDDFIEMIQERFEKLDSIKIASIRRREEDRLDKSYDDFVNVVDRLTHDFENILDEGVHS